MRQLFCFCLAIVLGFLWAVSPVILPTGLTAREQGASASNTKLFIEPLERENSIEVDGITITIPMLDPFVLPIPKKQPHASTPVSLIASIKNGRQTPLRSSLSFALIPELVGKNDRALQPKVTSEHSQKTQPSYCYLLKPDVSLLAGTNAELFWQNNQLQFAGGDRLGNRWFFEDLEPGTYQLRLKYFNPHEENSCLDRETQKIEPLEVDELVTPFVTLHLVEPVSPSSNAIEINGVRFETVVSPQILTIPPNRPDAEIPIRMGLRITNNTSDVFRFNWCCGISPEIRDSNGKSLQNEGFSLGLRPVDAADFPLVLSGESTEFFVDGTLLWYNNLLLLTGENGTRGRWLFGDLKPDTYQVRFTYIDNSKEIELPGFLESRKFTGFWTGEVVTPSVKIDLVSKIN